MLPTGSCLKSLGRWGTWWISTTMRLAGGQSPDWWWWSVGVMESLGAVSSKRVGRVFHSFLKSGDIWRRSMTRIQWRFPRTCPPPPWTDTDAPPRAGRSLYQSIKRTLYTSNPALITARTTPRRELLGPRGEGAVRSARVGTAVTSSAVAGVTLPRLWWSTRSVGVSLSGVVRSNANSAGEGSTITPASDHSQDLSYCQWSQPNTQCPTLQYIAASCILYLYYIVPHNVPCTMYNVLQSYLTMCTM